MKAQGPLLRLPATSSGVRGQVKKQKTETQRTPFLLIHTAVSKDREAIFFFFFFLVFPDRVSLYSPGCPGTHFVDQAGLELKNPPASASQVLGLKAKVCI